MTYQLSAIVNGQTFLLNDHVTFGWMDYDAFGLPPIQNITEQGPLQHGVTWLDFRLGPRIIPFTLSTNTRDIPSMMSVRGNLLDMFPPGLKVSLLLGWDGGNYRQLDCYVNGGLSFGRSQMRGFNLEVPVELLAPDPCWYDPVQQSANFGLGAAGLWQIPWAIPWAIGATTLDQSQTINYYGNWQSFPVIILAGPITNPVIYNNTTGEKLDFAGQTIAGGHYYTIDCRYGYKTVIDDTGTAKFPTTDSNLSTFHLDRRLAGETFHTNSIRVTGSSVGAACQINFAYYNRFTGA